MLDYENEGQQENSLRGLFVRHFLEKIRMPFECLVENPGALYSLTLNPTDLPTFPGSQLRKYGVCTATWSLNMIFFRMHDTYILREDLNRGYRSEECKNMK